jgi:hypothetical protein
MVRHLLPRHGLTGGGKVGMGEEVRRGVLHRIVPLMAPIPMKGERKGGVPTVLLYENRPGSIQVLTRQSPESRYDAW